MPELPTLQGPQLSPTMPPHAAVPPLGLTPLTSGTPDPQAFGPVHIESPRGHVQDFIGLSGPSITAQPSLGATFGPPVHAGPPLVFAPVPRPLDGNLALLGGSARAPPGSAKGTQLADAQLLLGGSVSVPLGPTPSMMMVEPSVPHGEQCRGAGSMVAPIRGGYPASATRDVLRPQSFNSPGAVDGCAFGVVCGPSASAPAAPRVGGKAREGDVSHRMNDLLTMFRSRLAATRRNAQDAEEKLQVAEDDLIRIGQDWREFQNELDVVRRLFDSEAATPPSDGSGPVPEETLERARRGWELLADSMARDGPPAPNTGPERTRALLADVLQQQRVRRRAPRERSPAHGPRPVHRWLERGSRLEVEQRAQDFGPSERAPIQPLDSNALGQQWPLKGSDAAPRQKPQRGRRAGRGLEGIDGRRHAVVAGRRGGAHN